MEILHSYKVIIIKRHDIYHVYKSKKLDIKAKKILLNNKVKEILLKSQEANKKKTSLTQDLLIASIQDKAPENWRNVRKNWRNSLCELKFAKPQNSQQEDSSLKTKAFPCRQNCFELVPICGRRSSINLISKVIGGIHAKQGRPEFLKKSSLSRQVNCRSELIFSNEDSCNLCCTGKLTAVEFAFSISAGSSQCCLLSICEEAQNYAR